MQDAIKGLLYLTSQRLKDLENYLIGFGSDFLAHLADGASHAIRGQCVYRTQISQNTTQEKNKFI